MIGLGPGGQGRWCTFSDAFSDYQFRTWNQVQWPEYITRSEVKEGDVVHGHAWSLQSIACRAAFADVTSAP